MSNCTSLKGIVGNQPLVAHLSMLISAAKARNDCLAPIIFSGAPGFGKSTISGAVAFSMGGTLISQMGPLIKTEQDIINILKQCDCSGYDRHGNPTATIVPSTVFIDECARLKNYLLWLPILQDRKLYRTSLNEEGGTVQKAFWLPKVNYIFASQDISLVEKPLLERCLHLHVEPYTVSELMEILKRYGEQLELTITPEALEKLANHAQETPRQALHLIREARDYALTHHHPIITETTILELFQLIQMQPEGLSKLMVEYLVFLEAMRRPVSLNRVAAALFDSPRNISERVEPFLIRKRFLQVSSKGRTVSPLARQFLDNLRGGKNHELTVSANGKYPQPLTSA